MQKIPQQINKLFAKISADFPKLLGDNLVGIYISGSLTYNAFNRKSSDVDFIVILNHDLSKLGFEKLRIWLKKSAESNSWVNRSQLIFLIKKQVLAKGSPRHEFHEGVLKRGLSDANPIILLNLLKNGVTLYGLKPKAFLPKITKKVLHDALRLEVNYLREGVGEKKRELGGATLTYQVFAVLTLCRIFYTYKKGGIVSKERAAKWCIKNLSKEWTLTIKTALKNINKKSILSNLLLESSVPNLVSYIGKQLQS